MVEADEEREYGRVGEETGAGFGVEGFGNAADFEVGGDGGGVEVGVVVGPEDEVALVEDVVVDFVAEFGGEAD